MEIICVWLIVFGYHSLETNALDSRDENGVGTFEGYTHDVYATGVLMTLVLVLDASDELGIAK